MAVENVNSWLDFVQNKQLRFSIDVEGEIEINSISSEPQRGDKWEEWRILRAIECLGAILEIDLNTLADFIEFDSLNNAASLVIQKNILPPNLQQELKKSMLDRNPAALLVAMEIVALTNNVAGISKTGIWIVSQYFPSGAIEELDPHFGSDIPSLIFESDPPVDVEKVETRNTLLVVGTVHDGPDSKDIEKAKARLPQVNSNTKISYVKDIEVFWPAFFATDLYLDEIPTKPCAVVTSGCMRAHARMLGYDSLGHTWNESKRLEQIANRFNIPTIFTKKQVKN